MLIIIDNLSSTAVTNLNRNTLSNPVKTANSETHLATAVSIVRSQPEGKELIGDVLAQASNMTTYIITKVIPLLSRCPVIKLLAREERNAVPSKGYQMKNCFCN